MMKIIFDFKFLMIAILMTSFIACDKDALDNSDETHNQETTVEELDLSDIAEDIAGMDESYDLNGQGSAFGKHKCFIPVFPITIEFPDGTTTEVDSKESLRTLLMEWRENNPESDDRPQLVFPFDIELKNGKILTIESKKDLMKVIRKCKKHRKKKGHGPG